MWTVKPAYAIAIIAIGGTAPSPSSFAQPTSGNTTSTRHHQGPFSFLMPANWSQRESSRSEHTRFGSEVEADGMRCGFALTWLPKQQDPLQEAQSVLERQLFNMVDTKQTPSNEYGSFKGNGWLVNGHVLHDRPLQWRVFATTTPEGTLVITTASVEELVEPCQADFEAIEASLRLED